MTTERVSDLGRGELLRQAVHIGSGLMAVPIVWWGPGGTALLAAAALAGNVWLLPRVAPALLRPTPVGRARTADVGVVAYPLVVLLLALTFWQHPAVIAGTWGVLAFGDGCATLVGRGLGGQAIPWNRRKTWVGTLTYWVCGTIAASLLVLWTEPGAHSVGFVWAVCAAVVLLSAGLESLPLGLDDNLVVPPLTAVALLLALGTEARWLAATLIAF